MKFIMKSKFFLLFALSLVLISCEKNDEPLSPLSNNVKIVALSGNTIHSINTADSQLKTTTIDDSYGVLKDLFLHNGEIMLFSKARDGYRMMKYDGNNITDNNIVTLLNDYLADLWLVSIPYPNNSYYYLCRHISEQKYVIIYENGNSKEYFYKNEYNDGEAPSRVYSINIVDGYGNFYQAYTFYHEDNPSGIFIVEKNGQKLYQVNGLKPSILANFVGDDLYLLGYNSEGNGVYAVNSSVVVDDHFSFITCACIINGQLCLGGYKTDEHKVRRATMKIGNKYYDLTNELGWYEYKDTETGKGNNHSSYVERFLVENNEIYALVRKYSLVNPLVAGGAYSVEYYGDAIFRNTHKVMDMGNRFIRSFVVIPEKK